MPDSRPDVVDQNLKCLLSDAQKIRIAESLAQSLQDLEGVEEDKKQKNHEFAERIDGLNKSIKKAFITLGQGYEYRWVPCRMLYNVPKAGEKTIVRLDTGEEVRIDDMSFAECQETIRFEKPAEAAAPAIELVPDSNAEAGPEPSELSGPDSPPAEPEQTAEANTTKRKRTRARKAKRIAKQTPEIQPHASV